MVIKSSHPTVIGAEDREISPPLRLTTSLEFLIKCPILKECLVSKTSCNILYDRVRYCEAGFLLRVLSINQSE